MAKLKRENFNWVLPGHGRRFNGTDQEMQKFYQLITDSEAKHHMLFIDLASLYFNNNTIETRLDELLDIEAGIVQGLPLRSALH